MKIFICYSRRDGDIAQHIYEYFQDSDHEVFIDVSKIQLGAIWSNTIETNISSCDVFVVIITTSVALRSPQIEKEVLQAQNENKTIIPCIHKDIKNDEIKWGLNRIQGIEFEDKFELARNLYWKFTKSQKENFKRPTTKPESTFYPPYKIKEKPAGSHNPLRKKIVIGGIAGSVVLIVILAITSVGLFNMYRPSSASGTSPIASPSNMTGSNMTSNSSTSGTSPIASPSNMTRSNDDDSN